MSSPVCHSNSKPHYQLPIRKASVRKESRAHLVIALSRILSYVPILVVGTVLYLIPRAALGQQLYGSINGNVTDPKGLVVPGTTVEVLDQNTNFAKQTITDAKGEFQILDLNPGTYTITFSSASFKQLVLRGIVVDANASIREDAKLAIGSNTQSVTVTSELPPLQTTDGVVSFELNATQVEDLPDNAARSYTGSFVIIPGFGGAPGGANQSQNPGNTSPSQVNGVSGSNNSTLIDGVSNYYPYFPQYTAYSPSNDAIRNVNVVTASFLPEQGTAAGAVINVITKSGTNQFHGGIWEYNQISALSAETYFQPPGFRKAKLVINYFGGNLGGPIYRNKAFFFFNFERQRRSNAANGFQSLPLDAYRGANSNGTPQDACFDATGTTVYDPLSGTLDSSGRPTGRIPFGPGNGGKNCIPAARIAPAVAKLISLAPEPNLVSSSSTFANDNFTSTSVEYTRDVYDTKVTFTPNSKSTLFARYGAQRGNFTDPPALGAAGGSSLGGNVPVTSNSLIQSVGLGGTYTFTSRLLLDANVGYTRQGLGAAYNDLGTNVLNIPGTNGPSRLQGGLPSFSFIGGSFTALGDTNISSPLQYRDNTYSNADNLTYVIGHHSVRAGFAIRHYQINHFQPNIAFGPRGGFSFSGNVTAYTGPTNAYKATSANAYTSYADFLLGLPTSTGKDTQVFNPATLRESDFAFYLQDQWRATSNLSLTYGMRFELYPIGHHDHFGFSRLDPSTGLVSLGGINGVPNNAGTDPGSLNYAPRFGFAYSIDKNTVLRGGFGISTNPNNYREIVNAYPTIISQSFTPVYSSPIFTGVPGNTTTNSNLPAISLNPLSLPSGGLPNNLGAVFNQVPVGIPAISNIPSLASGTVKLPPTIGTQTYPDKIRRGYIESYNLGVQRIFPLAIQLNVAYVGVHVIRESRSLNLNASALGTGITGGTFYQNTLAANGVGSTSQPSIYVPSGTANYNSLQVQAKRRFGSTIFGSGYVGVTYVYSKAMDDYGENSDTSPVVQAPGYTSRNYAAQGGDNTHSTAGFANYVVPFGPGHAFLQHGVLSYILRDFQFDTISYYRTGQPFTIVSSVATNAIGSSQFAKQVKPNIRLNGGKLKGTAFAEFDTSAYANPTINTFGNAGRNAIRAFPLFSLNFNAARSFKIKDWATVRFQAQVFDATNTPYFAAPANNVSVETFDASGNVTSRNGFGSTTASFVSRNMQLSGRIVF